MESESPSSELSSFIESLISSRNRDVSLFLPFLLGLNAETPLEETENQGDRIILINPFTQEMVLFESANTGFDSLFDDLFSSKGGLPPASKASIDAMESVDVENDGDQCVICLEEWKVAEKATQMPCKHMFHQECIVKWLKIHGSSPVCRYEMPRSADDGENRGRRRREIWVSFALTRSGELADQELQN